jgi:DNA replication and repair protein RecF
VAARVQNGAEPPFDLGTGTLGDGPADRRAFRLDGAEPRTQAEIAARIPTVWVTPQMDQLFTESASGRRKFLDRLVWALEPDHARQAAAHDNAVASRNKLLAERRAEAAWLAGLEDSIARHAVAVAAARRTYLARLNGAALPPSGFPRAHLSLIDPIAARLSEAPALAVEDWVRASLAVSRATDAAAGATSIGAHRADLGMEDAATGLPAAQASTGQRKALLLGIILAHAALIGEARGTAPVLLLDEPAVHLDEERRAALFAALAASASLVLITDTDPGLFAPLRAEAGFWRAGDGQVKEDVLF